MAELTLNFTQQRSESLNDATLEMFRQSADLPAGTISYLDTNPHQGNDNGVPAFFVHGVGMNAYLWSKPIAELKKTKRCIAIDLPLHGLSPCHIDQDLSLSGLANLLLELCSHLDLGAIDLVGNDSGGAIAQVLATSSPELIRSLVLTNCDVHSNLPPESFQNTIELAKSGKLWETTQRLYRNSEMVQSISEVAKGYEHPEQVSLEKYQHFLDPVLGSEERCRQFEKLLLSLRAEDLMAIEHKLCELNCPALIIWGTADVFFSIDWAHWLQQRLANAQPIVVLEGAKLFFPDERPDEFLHPAQTFWDSLGKQA